MSVPLSNPSVGRILLIVGGVLSVSMLFGPSFWDRMVWGLVRGQSGRLFFCHSSVLVLVQFSSLGVSLVLASWLERVGWASIHKPSGCFTVPCQFALVSISWLFCRDNGVIVPFSYWMDCARFWRLIVQFHVVVHPTVGSVGETVCNFAINFWNWWLYSFGYDWPGLSWSSMSWLTGASWVDWLGWGMVPSTFVALGHRLGWLDGGDGLSPLWLEINTLRRCAVSLLRLSLSQRPFGSSGT